MRKRNSIVVILAACAVALSVAACTVTKNADSNNGTVNDGVNLHFGDGSLNVDTPVFKMDKAGKGDKLHVEIPQMKIESK